MRTAVRWAFAAPPSAAVLLLAALAVAEAQGFVLVGDEPISDLAEAAAMGEPATVVRMIGAGEDPNRVRPVRPERVGANWASANEAAVLVQDLEMVRLLDAMGAIVGGDRWRLACLAADLRHQRIVDYLMPGGVTCDPGAAIGAVRGRKG